MCRGRAHRRPSIRQFGIARRRLAFVERLFARLTGGNGSGRGMRRIVNHPGSEHRPRRHGMEIRMRSRNAQFVAIVIAVAAIGGMPPKQTDRDRSPRQTAGGCQQRGGEGPSPADSRSIFPDLRHSRPRHCDSCAIAGLAMQSSGETDISLRLRNPIGRKRPETFDQPAKLRQFAPTDSANGCALPASELQNAV